MDKYHIYEEIGKGDFSQVFKGREKKKIEYVAIKRIEKSVMPKVSDRNITKLRMDYCDPILTCYHYISFTAHISVTVMFLLPA